MQVDEGRRRKESDRGGVKTSRIEVKEKRLSIERGKKWH